MSPEDDSAQTQLGRIEWVVARWREAALATSKKETLS